MTRFGWMAWRKSCAGSQIGPRRDGNRTDPHMIMNSHAPHKNQYLGLLPHLHRIVMPTSGVSTLVVTFAPQTTGRGRFGARIMTASSPWSQLENSVVFFWNSLPSYPADQAINIAALLLERSVPDYLHRRSDSDLLPKPVCSSRNDSRTTIASRSSKKRKRKTLNDYWCLRRADGFGDGEGQIGDEPNGEGPNEGG